MTAFPWRKALVGVSLFCCGCENQVTIKKQTAEIHRLQEDKRLLQTERDQQNQSLAGCMPKLRKAEADIHNLKAALAQKKEGEEQAIEKKKNVKQKKKGKR
jgi:hypothetical protein